MTEIMPVPRNLSFTVLPAGGLMPLVEGKMQAGGKEYPQVGARWRGS